MAGTAAGLNSTLSDDQEKALFFQHLRSYEAGRDALKKAQKAVMDIGKKAKADLGPHAVSLLKISIDLRTNDEGEKDLQARLEREARVARWMGMPIGQQGTLFEPDRRTAGDRAEEEGFQAGSDPSTPRTPPERYGLTGDSALRWYKGFDDAQGALFAAFEKKGSPLLRPSADAPAAAAESAATEGEETKEAETAAALVHATPDDVEINEEAGDYVKDGHVYDVNHKPIMVDPKEPTED